ncbi:phosphatase PAP2 family protein [Aeromicrobium sp.]|uniref:phosphatase PAP2 family protein n=1 Tax=Aeromicrobium sp. TaxID=1871063 RepID=UPI0035172882
MSLTPVGTRTRLGVRAVVLEVALIAVLYVGYSASRMLASDDRGAALDRAKDLLGLEKAWHLDVEQALNTWVVHHDLVAVASSYWYATAHYVVTAVVLVWLFVRRRWLYGRARTSLVVASLAGLACYLTVPMAPPRFVEGYTDVLALHSAAGWWGSDASAPRGMGDLTNELAAFPSLHAGWALWVALALTAAGVGRVWRTLGWAHALVTAFVVVGTGNHWLLDVVGGWAVVAVAWATVEIVTQRRAPADATVAAPTS